MTMICPPAAAKRKARRNGLSSQLFLSISKLRTVPDYPPYSMPVTAGVLLTNGLPKYPVLISLASEAIRDEEIAAFTNYVAAGGFLFVGGSAFTRNTNGTTRGDFAIGNQLGLHMASSVLTNWTLNNN